MIKAGSWKGEPASNMKLRKFLDVAVFTGLYKG